VQRLPGALVAAARRFVAPTETTLVLEHPTAVSLPRALRMDRATRSGLAARPAPGLRSRRVGGRALLAAVIGFALGGLLVLIVGLVLWRGGRLQHILQAPAQRGRILYKSGRFDEAIEKLELALEAEPTNPELLRYLAKCYEIKGQLAKAISWAERASEFDPTLRAHLLAGELELRAAGPLDPTGRPMGKPTAEQRLHVDKAVRHAEAAMEIDPRAGPPLRLLAEATARLGDLPKAMAHVQRAIELDPDSRATRLLAAQLLMLTGQPKQALDHCQHIVGQLTADATLGRQERADLLRALGLAADISTKLERYDESIALWQKFIKEGGDGALGHIGLAVCYFCKQDYQRTIKEADIAARLLGAVESYGLFLIRGNAFLTLENYDRALADLRAAAQMQKNDCETRYKLGLALRHTGQPALAREAFMEAIALDPCYLDARLALIAMLEGEGEIKAALEQFGKAAAADPNNPAVCEETARFCMKHGLRAEAEEALERLLRVRPDSPDAAAEVCRLRLDLGDPERALPFALRAARLRPDGPEFLALLARVEEALGSVHQAAAHYERAVQVRPAFEEAFRDLAALHQAAGDADAAQDVYDRARKAIPGSVLLRCAYARFCFATGRDDEGLKELRQAMERHGAALEPRVVLADYELARGQKDAALGQAREAVRLLPKSVDAHALLARVHRARGEWDGFLAELKYVVEELRARGPASRQLPAAYVHEAQYEDAAAECEEALRRFPADGRKIHLEQAVARFLDGRHVEATDAVRRIVSRDLGDPDAAFVLSLMRLAQGGEVSAPVCREYLLPEVAQSAWADLAARSKKSPAETRSMAETLLRAYVYSNAGWHDTAAEEMERIRDLAPDCLFASCMVPALWERAGERGKAIAACERALRECKDFAYGRLLLADLLVLDGKLDRAKALYAEHAASEKGSFQARTKLALLSGAMGDHAAAIQSWRAILGENKRDIQAWNNVAWHLATQPEPDVDGALRVTVAAHDLAPGHPAVLDTSGWVRYVGGNTKKAVELLEGAAKAADYRALYHFHLGMAYARERETEKARMHLLKALILAPDGPFVDEAHQALRRLRL